MSALNFKVCIVYVLILWNPYLLRQAWILKNSWIIIILTSQLCNLAFIHLTIAHLAFTSWQELFWDTEMNRSNDWDGEVALQSRAGAALPENQNSIPRTTSGVSQNPVTPALVTSNTPGLCQHMHSQVHIPTKMHKYNLK